MKRVIVLLLLVALTFGLAGCSQNNTPMHANNMLEPLERYESAMSGYGYIYIVKDMDTNVCYIICSFSGRWSMCPYYVINENGKPEIAVYGVNYFAKDSDAV